MVSGGNHPPKNPAPVSGPGRLSKRTDGPSQKLMTPSGLPYGDRKALGDQERTAPLAQTPTTPTMPIGPQNGPGGDAAGPPPQMPPFGGPTARPDEPVTHGVDIGPGGGPGVMPTPPVQAQQRGTGAVAEMLRGLSTTDTTGDIATLYQAALTRGV